VLVMFLGAGTGVWGCRSRPSGVHARSSRRSRSGRGRCVAWQRRLCCPATVNKWSFVSLHFYQDRLGTIVDLEDEQLKKRGRCFCREQRLWQRLCGERRVLGLPGPRQGVPGQAQVFGAEQNSPFLSALPMFVPSLSW
jgi:hypothetical protein